MVSKQQTLWQWIEQGRRRRLVVTQLYKPLTCGQLCTLCQKYNPKILLQDVHALLLQLIEKGLVRPANRRVRNGRVYFLTRLGCQVLSREAGLERPPLDRTVDWEVYGKVLVGRLRRLLLLELNQPTLHDWMDRKTTVGLKKRINRQHSAGLSSVAKTLRSMEEDGLATTLARTDSAKQRVYGITDSGRRLLEWLER